MNDVVLSNCEFLTAAVVGARRQVQNLVMGRMDRHGAEEGDGWGWHIEGACGEMALAKHLGMYWSGEVGDLDVDDVGTLQVRTTTHANGCLLLHHDDKDDRAYVLCVGKAPKFKIIGWIKAADGKNQKWWTTHKGGKPVRKPAFFVPQSELRSVDFLKN